MEKASMYAHQKSWSAASYSGTTEQRRFIKIAFLDTYLVLTQRLQRPR